MNVLAVVLIVWFLVAIVALALARTLCAAAARGDAEHAEQMARRPVGRPRHAPVSASPDAHERPRLRRRSLVHR